MSEPFDLAAMRWDREAGTGGRWWVAGKRTIRSGERHWIAKLFWGAWEADARRVARVPAMEAEIERLTAALAAEREYAERLAEALRPFTEPPLYAQTLDPRVKDARVALAVFAARREERQ